MNRVAYRNAEALRHPKSRHPKITPPKYRPRSPATQNRATQNRVSENCVARSRQAKFNRALLGNFQSQKSRGVEVFSLPADGEVKVRAGGASARAAQANLLASIHGLAFGNLDLRQVHVKGKQSLP